MQQANIINMITNKYEPQQKHRLGTVSKEIPGGGGDERGGALKPVLRDPNLALGFHFHSSFLISVKTVAQFHCTEIDHQSIIK